MTRAVSAEPVEPVGRASRTGSPDGFKQTELGQIPESWQVRRLGEVARIGNGSTPKRTNPAYWEAGTIPWLTSAKVHDIFIREPSEFVTELAARECHLPVVAKGSVVVAITGQGKTLGNAAIVTFDTRINQHLAFIEIHDRNVAPEFLLDYLLYRYEDLRRAGAAGGSTKAALTCTYLETYPLPVPPLPEQRAIAAVLSKIQAAVEVQDKIVATLKELKAATMAKLFRDGLRGEPLKQTEIGEIPESWQVVRLHSILAEPLRNGHSAVASIDHKGVRTLTLTAVTQGDFSLANTKVTTAEPARVKDLWLRDGDIFVERANTAEMVGLAALYRGRSDFAIFPDLLIRVRVDSDELAPHILVEWLRSPWCRSYFQKHCRGAATSMPKIDHRTVQEVPVPIPRIDEQQLFVQTIRALDSRFSTARQRGDSVRLLFSSMLHLLMTGQVRVNQLGLRDGHPS